MFLPILIKSAESYFFQYFTSRFTQIAQFGMFHSVDFGKLLFFWNPHKIPYNMVLFWFLLQFVVGSAHFGPRLTGLICRHMPTMCHNELISKSSIKSHTILIYTFQNHEWSPKHDDVIKWKHFPRYWPFARGIHRWIPLTMARRRSFDVFFNLRLNKRLGKQS